VYLLCSINYEIKIFKIFICLTYIYISVSYAVLIMETGSITYGLQDFSKTKWQLLAWSGVRKVCFL
jgi:hypothetical protein